MLTALRTALAVVVGYVVMVALITLVQEVGFGGVSYHESSRPVLLVAGALTFGAAIGGGMTAAAVARSTRAIAGAIMSGLVVLETIYLVTAGQVAGPLWFDVLASGSLVVGILLGVGVLGRLKRAPDGAVAHRPGAAAPGRER